MSLASFICPVSLFWLIIHGLQRLIKRRRHRLILPFHRRGLQDDHRSSDLRVTLQFLQVRLETSRWNKAHDGLLTKLSKGKELRSRLWMERFYTLGYATGAVGMGVSLGLLVWTTWILMKPLSFHKVTDVSNAAGRLMRRDVLVDTVGKEAITESPITPILPGVTVPLNHIPVILLALFLSQVVHELGHAVSGAVYGVPVLSSGASLTVCIPAAFVSFSSATLDALRPSIRSRVIAAGPFHSLLFWCFWLLAGYTASGFLYTGLGYKDISSIGRVVLDLDAASPLVGYVTPGTLITKLNDYSIASSSVDPDPWSSFLKSSKVEEFGLGWCVSRKDFGAATKECCLPDEDSDIPSLACFVANSTPNQFGCLDPIPILTATDEAVRCASENGCSDGSLCLRPAEKEAFLRLTVKGSDQDPERVVLWSGPRKEIWEEVLVGRWLPRFSFVPLSLPLWINILWEYLSMVNLSLFLFNLVPISGLDGSHLLRSMLLSMAESKAKRAAYDLNALERADITLTQFSGEGTSFVYSGLERVISGFASLLVGATVILAILGLIRT